MLGATYGWRARLGIILPSLNVVTEPEYYRMVPEGVTVHTARMAFKELKPEAYEHMLDDVPRAAAQLADACVHAVAFACTSGSLYGGLGYDQKIIEMLKEHADCPCTTTSVACVEALRAMKMKRICVGSPYPEWVNQLVRKFLEDSGFEVVSVIGAPEEFRELFGSEYDMGRPRSAFEIQAMPAERVYDFALRRVNRPDCDGMFLACTGLQTLGVIDLLESELGKPVVSANQATLWKLLRLVGIETKQSMSRFGSLMTY